MTVRRATTTAVIAAGLSVGFAVPASAADFSGTYSLSLAGASGGVTTSWTAQSSCAPTGGCVAHIVSSRGWSGDAQLTAGRWTMTVDRTDGQSCPDGSRHAESQTWSWDATTLGGEVSGVSADPLACPQGMPDAFTLTKLRPA
jgi:hypothetical protein